MKQNIYLQIMFPSSLLALSGIGCCGGANKHLMTGPKGNSEFCFPETLNVPRGDGDDDYDLTLSNRRLQDIVILILKAVNGRLPGYISDSFVVRSNVKCLRGTNKLVVL